MDLVKFCLRCGREIQPRKKWIGQFEQIKYCSQRCRSDKSQDHYENDILQLLERRGYDKTICPSEVLPEELKSHRETMEKVRSAARRLVAKKLIVIMQKGVVVDPSTAKGPIRLKRLRV